MLSPDQEQTVALPPKKLRLRGLYGGSPSGMRIKRCPDTEKCLEAAADDTADLVLTDSYRINELR